MKRNFLFLVLLMSMMSGLFAQNVVDTLVQIRQKIKQPISKVIVNSNNLELNILHAENGNEIMMQSASSKQLDTQLLALGQLSHGVVMKGGVLTIRATNKTPTKYTLYVANEHLQLEVSGIGIVRIAAAAVPCFASIRAEDVAEVCLNEVEKKKASNQVIDVCLDTIRSRTLELLLKDNAIIQLKGAAFFNKLEVYQEDNSRFLVEDIAFTEASPQGNLKRFCGCPVHVDHLNMKLSDCSHADISLPFNVHIHRLQMEDVSVFKLNVDDYHADSLFVVQHDLSLIIQGTDTLQKRAESLPMQLLKKMTPFDVLLDSSVTDSLRLNAIAFLSKSDTTLQFVMKDVDSLDINLSPWLKMKQNKWADYLSYEQEDYSFNIDDEQKLHSDISSNLNNDMALTIGITNTWDTLGNILRGVFENHAEKSRSSHYWYGDWTFYWGFMGCCYNMNILPTTLYFPNTPYDAHIQFSTLSLEYQKKYQINARNRIGIGLALSWDNYRYNAPDSLPISLIQHGLTPQDFCKGKFVTRYVTVPLSYTYGRRHAFNIGLSVLPGYMFKANEKIVWKNQGIKQVQKNRNYTDVMPFKLDARLTLGWKWGSIYFQPSLLPVFKNGETWDVVPMRIGFCFF